MNNVEFVEVGDSTDNMFEVFAGSRLLYFGMFNDVIEKLAVLYVLHNQKQMAGGLYDFIQLDDGRMPNQFENVDLSGHSLNIGHINDLFLHQNLYRHFLPC